MLIIVSGTSFEERLLVMNILEAGGIRTVNDIIELPTYEDVNTLKEYEKINLIQERSADIFTQQNICVSLTSFVLKQLPENHYYNLLLIDNYNQENLIIGRNIYHNKGGGDNIYDLMKKRFVEEHIRNLKTWLRTKTNFKVCTFNFNNIISNPVTVINKFDLELKLNLDISKSLGVLYPIINYHLEKKEI